MYLLRAVDNMFYWWQESVPEWNRRPELSPRVTTFRDDMERLAYKYSELVYFVFALIIIKGFIVTGFFIRRVIARYMKRSHNPPIIETRQYATDTGFDSNGAYAVAPNGQRLYIREFALAFAIKQGIEQRPGLEALVSIHPFRPAAKLAKGQVFFLDARGVTIGSGFRNQDFLTTNLHVVREIANRMRNDEKIFIESESGGCLQFNPKWRFRAIRGVDQANILLESDDWGVLGAKKAEIGVAVAGAGITITSREGRMPMQSTGYMLKGEFPYSVLHSASTVQGHSGSPIMSNGKVVAIHCGSRTTKDAYVNYGFIVVNALIQKGHESNVAQRRMWMFDNIQDMIQRLKAKMGNEDYYRNFGELFESEDPSDFDTALRNMYDADYDNEEDYDDWYGFRDVGHAGDAFRWFDLDDYNTAARGQVESVTVPIPKALAPVKKVTFNPPPPPSSKSDAEDDAFDADEPSLSAAGSAPSLWAKGYVENLQWHENFRNHLNRDAKVVIQPVGLESANVDEKIKGLTNAVALLNTRVHNIDRLKQTMKEYPVSDDDYSETLRVLNAHVSELAALKKHYLEQENAAREQRKKTLQEAEECRLKAAGEAKARALRLAEIQTAKKRLQEEEASLMQPKAKMAPPPAKVKTDTTVILGKVAAATVVVDQFAKDLAAVEAATSKTLAENAGRDVVAVPLPASTATSPVLTSSHESKSATDSSPLAPATPSESSTKRRRKRANPTKPPGASSESA